MTRTNGSNGETRAGNRKRWGQNPRQAPGGEEKTKTRSRESDF